MAQINVDNVKKIVEKNMRNAGLEGQFERGWLDQIPVAGGDPVTQEFGLKTLRDIISQSIVDILTDTIATGSYSQGNAPGSQQVIKDPNIINITTNPLLTSSPFAARVGDDIKIDQNTDPVVITTLAALSAFMTTASTATTLAQVSTAAGVFVGSVPIPANTINGKIVSGSESVKIGD